MAVLVTGGTGFVGSYLARLLIEEKGAEVVLYDRYPRLDRIADVADRVAIVEGDILDAETLGATIDRHGVDRLAHLGGVVGAANPDEFVPYLRNQCMGTATVFETARRHGVRRIANASSVAVYGLGAAGAQPAREDDAAHPNDLYGTCKLWSEHVAEVYNREHGMEILSLRISASLGYGRLNRASHASGLTTERRNYMAAPELLALGEPVTMPPDDELSDFIYCIDTAEAFWLALDRPRPEHSVFNLSSERRPIGDMTRHLRKLLPDAAIEVSEEAARLLQPMDTTRLREELGFRPRHTLETGLDDYVRRVGLIP